MKIEPVVKKDNISYAGIPVLNFGIQIPEIRDNSRAAKRINKYYARILKCETEFLTTKLGISASETFEYCMSHSRFFEPFSFYSYYQPYISENEILTIKRFITINLGKACKIKNEFVDIWELKSGAPLKVHPDKLSKT